MVLFDPKGQIHRYETANDILVEFFQVRLQFYEKRKKYLVDKLSNELLKLSNKYYSFGSLNFIFPLTCAWVGFASSWPLSMMS